MAKSSYQNRLVEIKILETRIRNLETETRKIIENISDDAVRVKAYFDTGIEDFLRVLNGRGNLVYYQINDSFKGRPERKYVVLESGRVVSVQAWEHGDRH